MRTPGTQPLPRRPADYPRPGPQGGRVGSSVMHLPPLQTLLLLAASLGGAYCLPVKGGSEKTAKEDKSFGWIQPKDLDWSVTPGRLIPVSEATDDLPTPGYRMLDLQQRVPVGTPMQPVTESQRLEPPRDSLQQQTEKTEVKKSNPEDQTKVELEHVTGNKFDESKPESTDQSTMKTETQSKIEEKPLEHTSTTETPTSTTPEINKQTATSITEAPIPNTTKETPKVPVEEELMTKVNLPELCSISGIGCRDKPVKETPEIELPSKFFHESDKKIKPEEESQHSVTTENNGTKTNDTEDKHFPGKLFFEHTSRLSPVDNSITISSTESVRTESINNEEKEANNHQREESPSKGTESENPVQNSSEENIPKDQEHTSNTMSSSTEHEHIQSDVQVEEEIEQKKETYIQQTLPANSHQETHKQEADDGQIPFYGMLPGDNDGSSESEGQQVLQNVFFHEKEETSSEEVQKPITALRRLDESEEKEESHETTTLPKEVNDINNKTDIHEEIKKQSEHKTEASEEEKKLMEPNPFDNKNGTSIVQSDEPEKSLSIGERISSYWKSATDYVSKVLNI